MTRPITRYLDPPLRRDLKRKMVLLSGPRQVGKTTLARALPNADEGYLNWDVPAHRERILRRELPPGDLWVFDEIHKYSDWRDLLKGLVDDPAIVRRILVTGSARLDLYRRSGDSLQGRYHHLRLHPLSIAELGIGTRAELQALLELGGFPEPCLSGSARHARRWSREYRDLLIREEVVGLERVRDLGNLELLMLRLPELVGSLLSINAIREDLKVSHKTVANWLQVFERLFAIFRVSPFGSPRVRAIQKSQKHYHFDWSLVPDPAARFENLVASHLLKWVDYQQDVEGRDVYLDYFRDTDGREVDFVVREHKSPILLVEAKLGDAPVDTSLRYLSHRFPDADAWQLSATGTKDYVTRTGIRVAPAWTLLDKLI